MLIVNLSCCPGDHAYKQNKKLPLMEQMISPLPDIRTLQIDPITDHWMFLGTLPNYNRDKCYPYIDPGSGLRNREVSLDLVDS